MGLCSRSEAERRVRAGRVAINGKVVCDPEAPVVAGADCIDVDGAAVGVAERVYVALNKPRGLVVSTSDERGRQTVYALLQGAGLPWLAPVGRLDKASEGLLLLSNDPAWSARITAPATHVPKIYHVQIRGVPPAGLPRQLVDGIVERGERLSAETVRVVGGGERNTWLEIVLAEGRNRQIRRMLAACGHDVLRLLRTAIGPLALGDLPKGAWRRLEAKEVAALAGRAALPTSGKQPAATPAGIARRSRSRSPAGSRRPR